MRSDRPIRVVHAHDAIAFGGMERYLLTTLARLRERGHEAALLVPGWTDPTRASPSELIDRAITAGIPVLRAPDPGSGRATAPAREALGVRRLLRECDAEVLHLHTCRPEGGRKVTVAGRAAGVPVVRTEHCSPALFGNGSRDAAVRLCDLMTTMLLTVSEANRREQVEHLGRSAHLVRSSPIGIDLQSGHGSIADPRAARAALGIDPQRRLIGAVGRLSEMKGHDVFVEAMATVVREQPDTDAVIIGEGELRHDLQGRVDALGLTDRVRLVGFRDEVGPWIDAFDVAVLPSRSEGLPLALVEYMAHGRACVASDLESICEVAGSTAVLVPPGEPAMLARTVITLLDDPERSARLGGRARARVVERFDIDRHLDDLVDLYGGLRGGRRGRAGRTA